MSFCWYSGVHDFVDTIITFVPVVDAPVVLGFKIVVPESIFFHRSSCKVIGHGEYILAIQYSDILSDSA